MDPLLTLKIAWQTRELGSNDTRPLEELLAARDAEVARLIRYSRDASPFYAEFHRGLGEAPLAELPVLTKGVMMERFDDLVTDRQIRLADVERYMERLPNAPLILGRYRACSTSGSSGRRGFFVFDQDEWATAISSFRRSAAWCRIHLPLLTRRMAVVTSPVPWHMTAQVGVSLQMPWVRRERLDATAPIELLARRLNELHPRVVSTYPSVGRALAMEQLEGRLTIYPDVVFSGAEVLTPAVRGLMESAWGSGRVFDHYGATETGSIAAECQRHRLHLAEDLLVVEGVDRQNRPVPPGIATDKLLVTVLFRHTQPLIRYEISDRVVFSGSGCDCGLPWRVLEQVEGRDEEMLRLPAAEGGTREVHPVVFEGILDNLPAAGWQVTSNGDEMTVLLAGADGIDTDVIRDRLLAELGKRGVAPASVEVRRVAELSRTATGKAAHVRVTAGRGRNG